MTYVTIPTPPGDPITPLRAPLQAEGFELVAQDLTPVKSGLTDAKMDVYRAPAANNDLGVEWFLLLCNGVTGAQRSFQVSVAEGWDAATNMPIGYIPSANAVAPIADGRVSADPAPDLNAVYLQTVTTPPVEDGVEVKMAIDSCNRVIFSAQIGACVYAGLLDRFLPVEMDPIPLVVQRVDAGTSSATLVNGGCPREPGQTVVHSHNFRVQWHNSASYIRLYDVMSAAELYTQRQVLSPASCRSSRAVTSSVRGFFRGVRALSGSASAGDVLSERLPDGTTRTYGCSYAAAGVFTAMF